LELLALAGPVFGALSAASFTRQGYVGYGSCLIVGLSCGLACVWAMRRASSIVLRVVQRSGRSERWKENATMALYISSILWMFIICGIAGQLSLLLMRELF
jgi:hypothetical protein